MEIPKKPTECAPHVTGSDGVCSRDTLISLMRKFVEKETGKPCSNNKADIIQNINKILGCDSESCVLSNPKFVEMAGRDRVNKEKQERFRPAGPSDSTALLNNINIDEELELYVKKYPNFHPFPFRMIDFADTEPKEFQELYAQNNDPDYAKCKLLTFCNFKENLLANGKNCAGVVLNTDRHTGGGKHWFALFFDMRNANKFSLEYFNSSGNMPMSEVHEYLIQLKRKLDRLYPNVETTIEIVSQVQIQDSRTECGVYSLYFIISRLEGISLDQFRKVIHTKGIPDDKMIEFRKHLFRKHA